MTRGRTNISISRLALTLWVAGALALPALLFTPPSPAVHAQTPATRTINGFSLSGRFLEEWSRQGSDTLSVYINGLPITPARSEISVEDGRAYETQWFERAKYELHPENKRPYDVLLGRLGAWWVMGRGSLDPITRRASNSADQPFLGINKPADAEGRQKLWFPETKHTLSGKLLEYWQRYGGLQQFGFPLSEAFSEPSSAGGKLYIVQYFERARMELHPEKPTPYEVELGLLGVQQYKQTPTATRDLPIAPPAGVKSAREVIRIASSHEPANLTAFTNSLVSSRMRSLVEDGLTARDADQNVFPLLAWYVPTLENGGAKFLGTGDDRYLQVTYRMREGVKWSDGKEATSNDVVFHYRLMMHPDAPVVSRGGYGMVENLVTPDKYTAIFNFRSLRQIKAFLASLPDPENYSFLQAFVTQQKPGVIPYYSEIGNIYPEHVLSKLHPASIPTSSFARAPVGTGPFKVVKWIAGQEMVFEQNENYNLTDKPLLKRIEVRFITDAGGSFAGVKSGEVDLITSETFNPPPDASLTAQFNAAGMKLVSRPAVSFEHLSFYFDYGPFKERTVREAMITSINRQGIVDKVYRGTAPVLNGPVPPLTYHSLENPDFARKYPDVAAKYKLPIYQYNPDKAAQLLDSSGWRCPPGITAKNCAGGVREKGGVRLSFEYATTIQATRQQIQSLVQADLRAIGIDAQAKAYPANVFFDTPGPRSNGTTKLAQFAWVGSWDSDFGAWRCNEVYNPVRNSGLNEQRYCNPGVDRADSKYTTDVGPKVVVPASAEAQVIIMEDIAIIPLVQRPNIEVVSTRLVNYKLTNSQVTSFWNARQWWFK